MKIIHIALIVIYLLLSSCTKTADDLYQLSDENLNNKNVDQAILDLNTLLEKYPKDSLASKAQYKVASLYLNWKNDPVLGYKALNDIVSKYPNSIQANRAKQEIEEFPDFILNKAESLRKKKLLKEAVSHLMFITKNYSNENYAPKGQYMLGDLYMNDFRDFSTAIQEYRKVIENYSGSNQEPHALFMIGYIYANVLNDEKSAKIEYSEFLNRFPKHELTPSVKFELEYLGKSIEEIPALKHITS